jgi:hypothetical protein
MDYGNTILAKICKLLKNNESLEFLEVFGKKQATIFDHEIARLKLDNDEFKNIARFKTKMDKTLSSKSHLFACDEPAFFSCYHYLKSDVIIIIKLQNSNIQFLAYNAKHGTYSGTTKSFTYDELKSIVLDNPSYDWQQDRNKLERDYELLKCDFDAISKKRQLISKLTGIHFGLPCLSVDFVTNFIKSTDINKAFEEIRASLINQVKQKIEKYS